MRNLTIDCTKSQDDIKSNVCTVILILITVFLNMTFDLQPPNLTEICLGQIVNIHHAEHELLHGNQQCEELAERKMNHIGLATCSK